MQRTKNSIPTNIETTYGQYHEYSKYINGLSPEYSASLAPATSRNAVEEIDIRSLDTKQASTLNWLEKFTVLIKTAKDRGLVENAIVHGSFGDQTQTHYSDLDITLILGDGTYEDPAKSFQLRKWTTTELFRFMVSVDPLQHHGPFLIWNALADSYSERILPASVYHKAWAVFPTTLRIRRSTNEEQIPASLSLITADSLLKADPKYYARASMFSIKRYLSNLMLIPAFYMTDIGQPTLKADSFAIFYHKLPHCCEAIKQASLIRESWPATPTWVKGITSLLQRTSNKTVPHNLSYRLYKNRAIANRLTNDVMPLVPELCHALRRSLESN